MTYIDNIERQERMQLMIKMENEHAELDQEVSLQSSTPGGDQIRISRLKRRKLHLKDRIAQLKSSVLPDVLA